MKNLSTLEKVYYIISTIAAIIAIVIGVCDLSVYFGGNILLCFLKKYYIMIITAIVWAVVLFIINFTMPKKRVNDGMLAVYSKPSVFTNIIICLVFGLLLICEPILINYYEGKAQIIIEKDDNEQEDFEKEIIDPVDNSYNETLSLIEETIIKCRNELIPLEELEKMDVETLYYIRNGIYAFHGHKFKTDFYYQFTWYDPMIDFEDFDKSVFNKWERDNIENIKTVEKRKDMENFGNDM